MIEYKSFYNYDRLECAAVKLGLLKSESDEEKLINLHNQLVWHLYRPGEDPHMDAILRLMIRAILTEEAAGASDIPYELRYDKEGRELKWI